MAKSPIQLRRATAADAPTLAAIHVAAWHAAYQGLVPDTHLQNFTVEKRTAAFAAAIAAGAEETYLAEAHGDAVGILTIGASRDADLDARACGEIWGIYLLPTAWRRGIGKTLVHAAERILCSRGYYQIVLWVLAGNVAARSFYTAMGFAPDGATKLVQLGTGLQAVRYAKEYSPMMQSYQAREVMDCYNRTAQEYAAQFLQELEHKPFDRNLLNRFNDLLPAGSLIYDFGCGSGQTTKYMHDQQRHRVIGLDFAENAIRLAQARFGDIEFVVDDMLHSQMPSSSADGILAFYAIVHFTYVEIEQVLQEWWRLLKPAAITLFSFHVGEEAVAITDFLGVSGATAVWRFLDVDRVLAIAEQVGFKTEEAVIRYPYRNYEEASKRAYIMLRKAVHA